MKRILWFYIIIIAAALGCSKKQADIPEEAGTKFPPPAWQADNTGKYPATMTAVVTLPPALAGNAMESDKLAAFINDECRGVGTMIKVNNLDLYFVLIQGLPEESSSITFKYYNTKTAYMYEARPALTFLADGVYGTAEHPETLEIKQLK